MGTPGSGGGSGSDALDAGSHYLPLLSVTTRFLLPLPPPSYDPLPFVSDASNGPDGGDAYDDDGGGGDEQESDDEDVPWPQPTLACEEWQDVECAIAAETTSWIAAASQDRVYPVPPERYFMRAVSVPGLASQVAWQLDAVQRALNQAAAPNAPQWAQQPRQGAHSSYRFEIPYNSRLSGGDEAGGEAGAAGDNTPPPVGALEVEGVGLLEHPEFELLPPGADGGTCDVNGGQAFIDVVWP